MLQTDRKTEAARQTARDQSRTQRGQSRKDALSPAAALEAILAGDGWEQLPAEGVLGLSHALGNSALAELLARREAGPTPPLPPLPQGACGTAPAEFAGGGPALTEAPAFGAMAPLGASAPLTL